MSPGVVNCPWDSPFFAQKNNKKCTTSGTHDFVWNSSTFDPTRLSVYKGCSGEPENVSFRCSGPLYGG